MLSVVIRFSSGVYKQMDSNQIVNPNQNKQYLTLQHTYNSLMANEEPVSIYRIPIQFVANHIFGVKTNPQSMSPHASGLLQKIRQKPEKLAEPQQVAVVEQQPAFDIGDKQQSRDVVRLGLKGMKSLANVKSLANMSSYLSSLIYKKK